MDFDYAVMPAIIPVAGILVVWLSIRRIRSLPKKNFRRWRRVAERSALVIVALVAAVVAVSSPFNAIALHHFWAKNPSPGAFYAVNGRRMHMNCTGNGSPTIVLDSGLGDGALIWGAVQPELSQTTRVCSYDRAGLGGSEALPPPRDADRIAAELHELLHQANVSGPLVLMGHSIAGLYVRDYASRYPADIAGLVFVDASTPLQDDTFKKAMTAQPPPRWILYPAMRALFIAGVPRLLGLCSKPTSGIPGQAGMLEAEDFCRTHFGAVAAEADSFERSGLETAHTGPYGSMPILIISEDGTTMRLPISAQQTAEMAKIWDQMQENLKKLSTCSRRIIAKGSDHYIQRSRADLIDKEVPLFIEQIRGTAPQPANCGSTVTE